MSDILCSIFVPDSCRSDTDRYDPSFSGLRIATTSRTQDFTNSPSLYYFFARAIFHDTWYDANVTVSEYFVNFRKSWVWLTFQSIYLVLAQLCAFRNSWAMLAWCVERRRSKFEVLKCDSDVWHIKQRGFPFRSANNSSHSGKKRPVFIFIFSFSFTLSWIHGIMSVGSYC